MHNIAHICMFFMLSSVFLVFRFNRLGGDSIFALSFVFFTFSGVFESSVLPRIHISRGLSSVGARELWQRASRLWDGYRKVATPLGMQDSGFRFDFSLA